jgi:hypothetical protein
MRMFQACAHSIIARAQCVKPVTREKDDPEQIETSSAIQIYSADWEGFEHLAKVPRKPTGFQNSLQKRCSQVGDAELRRVIAAWPLLNAGARKRILTLASDFKAVN